MNAVMSSHTRGFQSDFSLSFTVHSNMKCSLPFPVASQIQLTSIFEKARDAPSHPPVLPAVPSLILRQHLINIRKLKPKIALKIWGILIADLTGGPLWAELNFQPAEKREQSCTYRNWCCTGDIVSMA